MAEIKKYIAVTIGPVFDTINLASSPSALWAASYMFSMLSKNVCAALVDSGVKQDNIVSPYFDTEDKMLNRKDGVGLFHDRIIFRAEEFDIEAFKEIKRKAIEDTVRLFGFDDSTLQYFQDYFMVSAVSFEAENPILESSKMLDCLELSKSFVKVEKSNPILSLYTSDRESHRNENLRNLISKMNLSDWQLYRDKNKDSVRSIDDIARAQCAKDEMLKKYRYYAIVRSDGDNMGSIIKTLDTDEKIREFSKTCLNYCAGIADIVHDEYGGVTIYSGGDDLLAIIPVENSNGNTVFDFSKRANDYFIECFRDLSDKVSLSLGICVCYKKFPLYEALQESAHMLFGVAKNNGKNCVAIRFQKHSGQSEGLVIPNKDMAEFIKLQKAGVRKSDNDKERVLLSAMHKISLFERMFNNADDEKMVINLFANTFDSEAHKEVEFIEKTLPKFFWELKSQMNILAITNTGVIINDKIDYVLTMNYILRIIKFFIEKAGDQG